MKSINIHFLLLILALPFIVFLPSEHAFGQCSGEEVLHTAGTVQVGCTEVTVTPNGSAINNGGPTPPCFYGPFGLRTVPASFTFDFSPAVTGVRIDVTSLDNNSAEVEEMEVGINGGFYGLPNSGTPDGCVGFGPAIVWPTGTLRADPSNQNGWGSTRNIIIDETITSLTIKRNWISGNHTGFNFSLRICCPDCQTDAGELVASSLSLCPDENASVPPAMQTNLDADDLLQYILFSDPIDTLGSIVKLSNTPEISFDPATMTAGATYYIAAIAGNDSNGNVDLNDPCLDLSNAIEVVWHPWPSVEFSVVNTPLCVDDCREIVLIFTGLSPFQLTGQVVSGNNVLSTFSENYTGMTGTLTICLPPNTPVGAVAVEATELIDGFCTCN